MWQSQDDIIKDLASLNDFGNPEDKEPYKALYSIGRGSKYKEKNKSSEKFIDSRTGEEIDTEDLILDNDFWYKGKGRGSLLGGFSRSKFQLQQQLRLARPLGSGDEAIESYCRRNQPVENPRNSITSLASEMDSKSRQITAGNLNQNLNLDGMKQRIKGVRNSGIRSNALINGLLTNCISNSEIQPSSKAENFVRIEDEKKDEENLDIDCKDIIVNRGVSDSNDENSCNEFNTKKSSDAVDEFLKGDLSGKSACLKDTFDSSNKTVKLSREVPVVSCETFNYSEEKEQRNEKVNEIKGSQNNLENNFYDSDKTQHERNEKYRLLGERLNRLRKIDPKASGIYEFSEISRFIAPVDIESETYSALIETNTVPTSFVVKDEDFPPLLNGNP